MKIPVGKTYLRCKNLNPNDENTITECHYQIGPSSYRKKHLLNLLVKIGEIKAYDILRTREQLGYVVHVCPTFDHDALGYSIEVQSQESKYSAEFIDERIENFRNELYSTIENMTDEEFQCYNDSDYLGCFIFLLVNGNNITKTELLEFYKDIMKNNNRKLCVQVIGNSKTDYNNNVNPTQEKSWDLEKLEFVDFQTKKSGIELITDIKKFKNTLKKY